MQTKSVQFDLFTNVYGWLDEEQKVGHNWLFGSGLPLIELDF